jgi:hypothetical protein
MKRRMARVARILISIETSAEQDVSKRGAVESARITKTRDAMKTILNSMAPKPDCAGTSKFL